MACTATVEDGLLLSVPDQTTQMPSACGVTATAIEEAYSETAIVDETVYAEDDMIAMLEERPGFYTLTVQKQGYQDYQIDNIGIGKDLCHVLTREFNVELVTE